MDVAAIAAPLLEQMTRYIRRIPAVMKVFAANPLNNNETMLQNVIMSSDDWSSVRLSISYPQPPRTLSGILLQCRWNYSSSSLAAEHKRAIEAHLMAMIPKDVAEILWEDLKNHKKSIWIGPVKHIASSAQHPRAHASS
jgi:hypothetical protein